MGKLILNGKEYVNSRIDGYPPLIYSADEREVGVWTDGKPLYQKTYDTGSINTGSTKVVDISSLNIDYVVNVVGCGYSSQYSQSLPLPFVHSQSIYSISVNTTASNSVLNANLQISTGSSVSLSKSSVTILYTKTTDTAGSGRWSNAGDQTHHYSTSEQVIGTWIDGKPLYEKIYTGTTNDLMNVVDSSVGYIEELIDIKVSTTSPNGNKYTLYYGASNDYLRAWLDDGGTSLRLYIGSSYPPRPVSYKIIIQYTKTTD